MKVACYSGTRNLYSDMVPAIKSLLHNSDVDKIYLLIEDDEFPEYLPPEVEIINVTDEKYAFFAKDGPNYNSSWTYMILFRVCLSKIFPEIDKILNLDVDTIVVDNINDIWDMVPDDKYFGAVREYNSHNRPYGPIYYNIGVAVYNLKKIREDHIDDLLIRFINTQKLNYPEQDAWNKFGVWNEQELPIKYNESPYTGYTDNPCIVHLSGSSDSTIPRREYKRKYAEMSWEDVRK